MTRVDSGTHQISTAGRCSIILQRDDFIIDAEFSIPARGVLGIFGHSGSGKTSLLRCIAGLEQHATGLIEVNNRVWLNETTHLASQQRNIGYIFQESRLFPHLTVRQNLNYGYKRSHTRDDVVDHDHLLDLLEIKHFLERRPHQLSGGEKQRVAIGRALMKNPELLLMDEPLASLDEGRKQEILPFLDRLHEELSIPMIYVSHSLDEVSLLCDHMVVLERGQVVFSGSIHDTLVSPKSPLSHAASAAAILEGTVIKQEKEHRITTVQTTNGNNIQIQGLVDVGKHLRLRILASDVSLCKTPASDSTILNVISGHISDIIEDKNAQVLLQIVCNQDIILARISKKSYKMLNLDRETNVFVQIKAISIQGV